MNRLFTNDETEGFLKESADGLRMHPSDKVWKGISKNLNERRRRMGFATGTFLLLTSALGYFLLNNSKNDIQPATSANAAVNASFNNISQEPENIQSRQNSYLTSLVGIAKKEEGNTIALTNNKQSAPALIRKLNPGIASKKNKFIKETITEQPDRDFVVTTVDDTYPPADAALTADENIVKVEKSEPLLTIESVTNIFKNFSRKKLSFQFFFTPTVSYRKLTENKSYLRNVPVTSTVSYAELYNVNDIVTHKPDIGLELGFAAKYPIAKSIQLRGGMQFNMNRYDIKAFTNSTELATIALNNGNNNVQMVGTPSNYRNFGTAGTADWLQNVSLQVSAPVGIEVKVAGSSKGTSFGVATTVQPTYVLGDRAYLLSTDYKNYSEVSWLMRRWNVASSVETFVAYSTGKIKWQVGPQVRYQLLSSFVTKYPVKENLFDFGLKVGVSLNEKKASETNQ